MKPTGTTDNISIVAFSRDIRWSKFHECVAALTGGAVFEPDYHALPALRLTFRF